MIDLKKRIANASEIIFRFLVMTPLHFFIEWMLFGNLLLHAFAATFLHVGIDYQSSVLQYLFTRFSHEQVGVTLFVASFLSLFDLLRSHRKFRILNFVVNFAYILVYVGAILITRPIGLAVYIASAFALLTILSLFKIVFVQKTSYTLR